MNGASVKTIRSHILTLLAFALFIWSPSTIFSMGGSTASVGLEPTYMPLEDGEGSYEAIIYDGKHEIHVDQFSFAGRTSMKNVRKEDDDSSNNLDLSKIVLIEVVAKNFSSERYADKEYSLLRITMKNGHVIEKILAPRKIVICGIADKSEMEQAWFINKIDRIEIKGLQPSAVQTEKAKKEYEVKKIEEKPETLVDQVVETAKDAGEKVGSLVKQAGSAVAAAVQKASDYIGGLDDEDENE